jgi:hypothetical protein
MIDDGTVGFTEMERFLGVSTKPSIGVSAEQLELLFISIKEKTIDFAEIKHFLEYPKGSTLATYPSYVRAINILGYDKVITAQRAHQLWNIPYSLEKRHLIDQIKYSEATLRKMCNRKQKASSKLGSDIYYRNDTTRTKKNTGNWTTIWTMFSFRVWLVFGWERKILGR